MRAFTLIETLLVLALLSLLVFISAPVYQSWQINNDLDIAANTVAQDLRRAQELAQASLYDSQWGVSVQTGLILLFKGYGYATRDVGYDEIIDMPPTITPSGAQEIYFSKMIGLPTGYGTLALTATPVSQTRTVVINSQGTITY